MDGFHIRVSRLRLHGRRGGEMVTKKVDGIAGARNGNREV